MKHVDLFSENQYIVGLENCINSKTIQWLLDTIGPRASGYWQFINPENPQWMMCYTETGQSAEIWFSSKDDAMLFKLMWL